MAKKKHPSHPLPAGVPAGSLFVNETTLTNDQGEMVASGTFTFYALGPAE